MSDMIVDPISMLPIGPEVPLIAALLPDRRPIAGQFIRLEPLDPERHGTSLWQETHGIDAAAQWQYLFDTPFADEKAFHDFLTRKALSADPLFYAIINQFDERAVGLESLMRIDLTHRCIEVGNILYGTSLQRTAGATEAQYLLMRYVFEDLHYRRYEWKCNALNAPSRRAALRFGFTFEGIFRKHMIVRGRSRDTAWYSMIEDEWPAVKAAFESWLAPANFHSGGAQRQSLTARRSTEAGSGVHRNS
jgi:RimJ/RimL family protein N-acetyltransferase